MQGLTADLVRDEFEPYLTSVGGSGLGILSPYGQHRNYVAPRSAPVPGQVTPPETPGELENQLEVETSGDGDEVPDPLRVPFETRTISELAEWAEGRGRWLYV